MSGPQRFILFLAALCLAALALPAHLLASPPDFVQLAAELKPAVVNISTSKTVRSQNPGFRGDPFFDDFFERFFRDRSPGMKRQNSLGSGFIISAEGDILTNNHVIDGADEIEVALSDGRTFSASVAGRDPKLDLALLKIEADGDLPAARLGDSDHLKTGEWVMAIGNPFGLGETVTVGIVSAKGRVIGAGPYDDFIQTDASINPGNSGGPLFNTAGEVVGINTAIIARGQGIGFAIPINSANLVLAQLREEGHVIRGWLGVSVQPLTPELAESFGLDKARGALVAEVVADSPADQAGLQRGDILLSFDGKPIEQMRDLPRIVAATPVGSKVNAEILRKGKTLTLKVTVGQLDEELGGLPAGIGKETLLGLKVEALTPELQKTLGLDSAVGVVISGIAPDSPAAQSELRRGDLILEVNGEEVASPRAFSAAIGKPEEGKVYRMLVQRRDSLFYTTIKVR